MIIYSFLNINETSTLDELIKERKKIVRELTQIENEIRKKHENKEFVIMDGYEPIDYQNAIDNLNYVCNLILKKFEDKQSDQFSAIKDI